MLDQIRVALITDFALPGRAPGGGTQAAAGRLARALSSRGVSVAVVAPLVGRRARSEATVDGIQVIHLSDPDRLSTLRSLRPWRRAAVRVVAELGVDLVHGQGVLGGGLPACDIDRVPRVVTAHGNARSDTVGEYGGLGAHARVLLRDRLVRRVIARSDVLINVHPDWRVNLPAPPRRLVYVPNIVDEAYTAVERRPEPGRVLYCGGGPRRIKGADVLFAAWPDVTRRVDDARLVAVGWPEGTAPTLEGAAGGRIELRGRLSPAVLAEEMARASVVVVPSRFEVAPLVLAEAWSVGAPVVATAVGGIPALADGAAQLAAPDDPRALAEGIVAVLRGDVDTDAMVREGHRRGHYHDASAVADAHLAVYRDLLDGGAEP